MGEAGERRPLGAARQHRPQFGVARAEPEVPDFTHRKTRIDDGHLAYMVDEAADLDMIALAGKIEHPAFAERRHFASMGIVQVGELAEPAGFIDEVIQIKPPAVLPCVERMCLHRELRAS